MRSYSQKTHRLHYHRKGKRVGTNNDFEQNSNSHLQLFSITYRKERTVKHNKKILSSRSSLVSCTFAVLVFLGLSLIPLGLVIFGKPQEIGAGLLLFVPLFGLDCFLLWFLNRAACVVWIEDGMIKRKGLIRGFYKECSVRSIQAVQIKYVHREVGFGTFIYLIDDRTRPYKKFLRIRKDSYICFRKNKRNLAFLRTFWSGEVEK